MAISWGSYEGHLRVGIDIIADVNATSVDLTVRFYVGSDGWGFDDDQTLILGGDVSGSYDYHQGGSTQQLVTTKTLTLTRYYSTVSSRDFTARVTGMYNGGTPSKSRSYTAPQREPDPPSAPSGLTADPGSNGTGAQLDWSPPSSTNGASVDRYQVQVDNYDSFYSPVYNNGTVTNSAVFVGGLLPGRTYYVRVRAHNSAGWSDWTAIRSFRTPSQRPDKPAMPSVGSVGATSASVSWTAPDNNGDSIDSYEVKVSGSGSGTGTWADAGSPRTVSGLYRATTYTASVRAHNTPGWSDWSSGRTFTTDPTVPSAPGRPSANKVSATSITVTWTAPTDSGGQARTGYDVQVATDSAFTGADTIQVDASASSAVLADGVPGATYYVRVRAINATGPGAWSAYREISTLSGALIGDEASGDWVDALVYVGDNATGQWVLCEVLTGASGRWF